MSYELRLIPIVGSRKRSRTPVVSPKPKKHETPTKAECKDEEDDEPLVKRPRRNVIEEDDSEAEIESTEPISSTLATKPKAPVNEKGMPATKKIKLEQEGSIDAEAEVLSKLSEERSTPAEDSASEAEHDIEDEDDEEDKPEVAAKMREKVQTTLKSSSKDPYPDWKPGEPVPYAALCTTFSLIEMTTKRLIIAAHCSLFLRQVLSLTPEDLLPTVLLMINKLAADYAGIELGIGESLIMKAIGEATGRSLAIIKQDQKEIGDLGLVAVKSRSKQPTMFKAKALTVRGMLQSLLSIATVTGNGAQQRKVDGIKKLLSAADANMSGKIDIMKDKGGTSEAKYIVRFLEGKLRLGLAEKTVLTSLGQAMVCHEIESKGKGNVPSTDQMAEGEAILKSVHRYV